MNGRTLTLEVVPGTWAVCRLPPNDPVPPWAAAGRFASITRTDAELSIVCAQENVPREIVCEKEWRCLRVQGPLGFGITGILASLAEPLARSGVSIFVVSTYDTDYLLLQERDFERGAHALRQAGHVIEIPS